MDNIQNLAFVKKYNYNKNYAIFLLCNLPIAILGGMLVCILSFGMNGFFVNGFKLTWYMWLTIFMFVICMVIFVFMLYGSRRHQEKQFNENTPENYIVYNVAAQTLTILNKEYLVKDMVKVDFRHIIKYDVLHFSPVNAKDNGKVTYMPKTEKFKSTYMDRKVNNISKNKTDVGDLVIVFENNINIYLQRVLNVDDVYNTLQSMIQHD